jgi:hypothetical protein
MSTDLQDLHLMHSLEHIKDTINLYNTSPDEYIDAHHWVFTKTSFELLLRDLMSLGFLKNISIIEIFDVVGCEFYVSLQKTDKPLSSPALNNQERLHLVRCIESELASSHNNVTMNEPVSSTSQKPSLPILQRISVSTKAFLKTIFLKRV